ncbi:hypothetical protein KSC_025460 [Ktedonobacter sp. SOSP1-52]|uniref:hypothetical protein n=1 Tax=Ktedonobacter sp. SOSP1-52 TaxID=2778366 RepID=UPI001916A2A0|nr:hypothetical protein [Ktedonobacter sp. SOSP1-52]GHO63654.1 hypothetical protein KSC_025460 [Ktedonobacter sp. SOSP1-52]
MKKQIEETLQCLIGQSFWGSGRAANLLTFQFGPRQVRIDHHGKSRQVGTYALHVQCTWRLTKAQRILAASGDLGWEPKEVNEETRNYEGEGYSWPKTGGTRLDEQLVSFFRQCEQTPLFVQAIQADDLGGLTIELTSQHLLTVFPDDSFDEEYWRFFQVGVNLPHFVVTGEGIEDQEE